MQRIAHFCLPIVAALLPAASACHPPRGNAVWRARTAQHGTLWIDTAYGQQWTDASYARAKREIAGWCGGSWHIVSEGFVSTRDSVSYRESEAKTAAGTVREGEVTHGGAQVWQIDFRCGAAVVQAAPAPSPVERVDRGPGSHPVDSPEPQSPPCCKP